MDEKMKENERLEALYKFATVTYHNIKSVIRDMADGKKKVNVDEVLNAISVLESITFSGLRKEKD